MPDPIEPTPEAQSAPEPTPAPRPFIDKEARVDKVRGLVFGALGIIAAVLVVAVGIYCLHPALLTHRPMMATTLVLLATIGMGLAYQGARYLHGADRNAAGREKLLWATLVITAFGSLSFIYQVNRREANRTKVEEAESGLQVALGSHFIIAYPGDYDAFELIRKGLVAGFFFDERHTEGLSATDFTILTRSLQLTASKSGVPPLLLCTDQEGGLVNKLSPLVPAGPPLKAVLNLGANPSLEEIRKSAFEYGAQQGKVLRSVGINMNLAPVADLMPPAAISGDLRTHLVERAVSADPAITQAAVEGFAAGLQSQGVRAVLKHFPGLGGVTVDTHQKTGVINQTIAELGPKDWLPFMKTAATLKPAPAVMLGHVSLPELDPVRLVSYSPRAVDLLQKVAPGSVTITDCYSMGPIWNGPGGVAGATRQALENGVDFILFAWDGDAYYDGLADAITQVETQMLNTESLMESVERVLSYRKHVFIPGDWEMDDPASRLKRGENPQTGEKPAETPSAVAFDPVTPPAPASANPNPVEQVPPSPDQPAAATPPKYEPHQVGDGSPVAFPQVMPQETISEPVPAPAP